jgi:predicted Zn-dependent peptidase
MKYNTHTLNCGLRVIHLPSDSHVVYLGYQIATGTRHEEAGEEGLAHFCEHVSFKGTEHRRAWHILNCLESVGGDLNAFTNKESTVYYSAILKEHAGRAVNLLTDIVFHSVYPQQEIDKEVEVICDEIESYNDSPAELIFDDFENILFDGHPLGHNILGTADRVRHFTTADALRFTKKGYKPQNMVFFIYGDINFSRLVKTLERLLSDYPSALPLLKPAPKDFAFAPLKSNEVIHNRNTHQAHVMIGARAYNAYDDERRMPLYLLNNILGGIGMNSLLNVALREKRGLVYTVESSLISYSDTGLWCIYLGCDESDISKCLKIVRRYMNRMVEEPLSERQLLAAKKQIKGQIGVSCDNRESFALDFGKTFLNFNKEKHLSKLFEQIDAISSADIQHAAEDIFNENKTLTLIYK